jgi:hypothetical protein
MTAVLPIGYVTILEAAEMLQPTMYAGVPDMPIVTRLRQEGIEVNDGPAIDRAIAELWKAVDKGTLRCVAIGGRPRRIVKLDAQFTKGVPGLRNPRGRGFTLLRQSNPAYHQLATWFGPLSHEATLAFRAKEVQALARKLMRARRTRQRTDGQKRPLGRSSRIDVVKPVIRDVIERGKWNSTKALKALSRDVNRAGKWPQPMSEDTVTRALDLLYEQTSDRRFKRVRRNRRRRGLECSERSVRLIT